jgi:hypothetical protein
VDSRQEFNGYWEFDDDDDDDLIPLIELIHKRSYFTKALANCWQSVNVQPAIQAD